MNQKEYLTINKREGKTEPDYYRLNKKWFYCGNNIQIIDPEVIDQLDQEFIRQYKSL